MPSRPDLRELASNVKDAFADADRETLLDVLTFVIKEYVVEGPPPMMIHQAETLSDLRAPTFAQLVTALQTRFDHPELAMFVVDGEQVGVRVGSVVQPLLPGRQPMTAERDGAVRVWVPVLEGSERTGVLAVTVPAIDPEVGAEQRAERKRHGAEILVSDRRELRDRGRVGRRHDKNDDDAEEVHRYQTALCDAARPPCPEPR